MEVAAPAAPAAEVVKPAEATPAPAPAVEVVAEQPERTFTQKELDEILEKRLGKERRKREDLDRRLKITEELALRRTEMDKKPEPAAPAPSGEPTRDQYQSYEAFLEARAEWRADQKVDAKFKEREDADRQRTQQSDATKEREQFKKAMKDSAKDIEDFDEVVGGIGPDDPVAKIAASAVEAADAPGKVLYHLAKHPEEAERIASLPVGKQAREIGKLEEKLAKPPVKPSSAPEPIKPVAASKTGVADEMPDAAKHPEKWMEWRKKQLAAKRGGQRAS